MRLFPFVGILLTMATLFAEKSHRPPEVTVSDITAVRSEGLIEIDATIRNAGAKPVAGLQVSFNFFTGDHRPVSTQRAETNEATLNTGEESTIHAQMPDAVRAVTLEVSVMDASGRELRVGQPGPYTIQ